jgi:citrate synthase
MDALRGAVGMLPAAFAEPHLVTGAVAVLAAAHARIAAGLEPVAPDAEAHHAADLLRMFGVQDDGPRAEALGAYLVTVADHGMNASTFAARVVASTGSDLLSSVVAALGALKGPLHGGANQDVIKWLLGLGDEEEAVERVRNTLARKVKIPGFGHRVYRTEDPRATHLRVLSEELGERTNHQKLYSLSKRMEETVKGVKGLNPNVDFYSASAYYSLGIPIDLYTPIFAVSRMSGWTAHVLEQYRNNRLIRPRAEYKGNPDGQTWIPIAER